MRLAIWSGGVVLGTTVHGVGGAYAHTPHGPPLGPFADCYAADAALARLAPVAA